MNIGCIFGDGDLPLKIIKQVNPKAIIWLNKESLDSLSCQQINLGLGRIGQAIDFLKQNNITHLIIVGKIRRPSLSELSLDRKGFVWLKKLGKYFLKGDDSLLRGVKSLLEEEGFQLIPSSSIIGFPNKGTLTKTPPNNIEHLNFGFKLLDSLSHFDVGQCAIIENSRIIGIEGAEGTDELIKRCENYINESGIIVKSSKIGQLDTLDIPTIGPDTINLLKDSKIIGIGIKNTQIVNIEKVISMCNEFNIFLHSK